MKPAAKLLFVKHLIHFSLYQQEDLSLDQVTSNGEQ